MSWLLIARPLLVVTTVVLVASCNDAASEGTDSITILEPMGTYVGRTCDEVGREFGDQLNDELMKLIDANVNTPGNVSGPMSDIVIKLAQGANEHLKSIALTTCKGDAMMRAADPGLSPELRAVIGDVVTTPAVTYDAWHEYVRGQLRVVEPPPRPS